MPDTFNHPPNYTPNYSPVNPPGYSPNYSPVSPSNYSYGYSSSYPAYSLPHYPPAGWYPDPHSYDGRLRWWNGYRWTDQYYDQKGLKPKASAGKIILFIAALILFLAVLAFIIFLEFNPQYQHFGDRQEDGLQTTIENTENGRNDINTDGDSDGDSDDYPDDYTKLYQLTSTDSFGGLVYPVDPSWMRTTDGPSHHVLFGDHGFIYVITHDFSWPLSDQSDYDAVWEDFLDNQVLVALKDFHIESQAGMIIDNGDVKIYEVALSGTMEGERYWMKIHCYITETACIPITIAFPDDTPDYLYKMADDILKETYYAEVITVVSL